MLEKILTRLPKNVFRVKGYFRQDKQTWILNHIFNRADFSPSPLPLSDPTTKLIFIGYQVQKNQAEIVTAVRANIRLSRDVLKLSLASDLLKFEDRTPVKLPAPAYSTSYRSSIGGYEDSSSRITMGTPQRYSSPRASYSPGLGYNMTPLPSSSSYRPVSAPRLPLRSTFDVASHGGSYASPLKPSGGSPYRSPSRVSTDYLPTARRYSAAMTEALLSSPPPQSNKEWRIASSLVEVESEVLKKKHLARFTPEEVCLLLEEMGFDRLDLRGFRAGRVDGLMLLELSEEEMMVDMVLQRMKIRQVQMLQKAVKLFDRIGEWHASPSKDLTLKILPYPQQISLAKDVSLRLRSGYTLPARVPAPMRSRRSSSCSVR